MKIIRKKFIAIVLLLMIIQLPDIHAQANSKSGTIINPVLHLDFPDSFSLSKNGFINIYNSGDSINWYELTYFDTVVVKTNNQSDFNLALKGFVAGKFAGKAMAKYELRLTDTLIGNLSGIFISGITNDTLEELKRFYCFVTIANSNNYWFTNYIKKASWSNEKPNIFFSSIKFERNKIKEATFKINPFKKHKMAGEIWYISPELDSPIPQKVTKKEKQSISSLPLAPPPPPIDRKWLFKANKIASNYTFNESMADKKYKKLPIIVVEGIIKEIKETNQNGITVIILDGTPAKIDLQCEILNSFKIQNLRKGMRATFDAHCLGRNGNVILSRCLYIENPTYE